MSLIARLAGVDLSAVGPVGWTFTPGGRPHTRVMEVSQRVADELLDKRGDFVSLEIETTGYEPLRVEKLLIVDIRAGKTPYTRAVMVADKRYLWRRKVIVRDFNMRRRTGETRLGAEGRIETQQALPTVAYAPWSLNKGQAFDAGACIESVLAELDGSAPTMPRIRRSIRIESLFLNDPGDVAVDKTLATAAGLNVWVDRYGITRVYDMRDGSEAQVIADAGAPVVGSGYHGRSLRAYARPRRCHVLLERESEVRFDFVEEGNAANLSTVDRGSDAREPRTLENVILQPDSSLSINGATVARGTILEFNAWLAAISGTETRTIGGAAGPLSQAYIRKYYMQWSFLVGRYGLKISGQPDTEWQKRLGAVRSSWRKLFRILPRWRDKMRSVKAYRLAAIDPTTGTRARTEPYMDYISKPSAASFTSTIKRNPDVGHQVAGWAERLEDGVAAPAIVTVLDEEAGVIRVDLQADPFGDAEALAPGQLANLPTQSVTGDMTDTAKTAYLAWGIQPLLSTFKLAVVLSCVQGAPNNAGRYHKVTVEPSAGSAILGVDIGECLGEDLTIYVPGGELTARFAWSDDFASEIEEAFHAGGAMPSTLLTNADQVKAVAEATAAREWQTFLDREECSMTVALNAEARIAGAIAMVDHTIMPKGPPLTTIMTIPEMQPVDRMTLVPTSIQNTIRHLVQP